MVLVLEAGLSLLMAGLAQSGARAAGWVAGGPVTSPLVRTGRWLTDDEGRVVVMHGFDIMWKATPFYPSRFTAQDAAFLANNGFTAARDGLIWAGVEPQPDKYDDGLLAKQAGVDALMGRYGIRTLFDFHQDGPGAFPAWAAPPNPAEQQYQYFWEDGPGSDGVGIQTHFVNMWRHVAAVLGGSTNIIGFDPLNEPQPPTTSGCAPFITPCASFESGQLAEFYRRVIAAIRGSDKRHVIWPEPVAGNYAEPPALPKFDDPQVGFNGHIYCYTFPSNTQPDQACYELEQQAFRDFYDNYADKLGEPVLISEFSSSDDDVDNAQMVDQMEQRFSSWMSWAYTNSTGGGEAGGQGYVTDDGQPGSETNVKQPKADAMVVPYAQAIAGTPVSQNFDRRSGIYTMAYRATPVPGADLAPGVPTQVFVPHRKYAHGYRVSVVNATVVSRPDWPWVEVVADRPGATVQVSIAPASDSTVLTPLQVGALPVRPMHTGSKACPSASGRFVGLRVGPLAIGMARAHALHAYPYVSHRGSTDYFCLTPAGVSVSYPTRALLQALPPAVRRRVRGRIVLILTPNSRFALRGLRPGRRFNGVPRAFGRTTRVRAAGRIWYLTDRGRIADLLEVHSGVIDEIGIADGRFLRTKPAAIRFLATFAAPGL